MMTKTDYELVADAINDVLWRPKSDPATVALLCAALSDRLHARYGERFMRSRFLADCMKNRDAASQTNTGGSNA